MIEKIKFRRNLLIFFLSLLGSMGIYFVEYKVGCWLVVAMGSFVAWMFWWPEYKQSTVVAGTVVIVGMMYIIIVAGRVSSSTTYKSNWKIIAVISLIIGAIDIGAFIRKKKVKTFFRKDIWGNFISLFMLFMTLEGLFGAYILPGTEKITEAYVTDTRQIKNNIKKYPRYFYYIKYVDYDGTVETSEVAYIIYKEVIDSTSCVYVTRGKNFWGADVRQISLSQERDKVDYMDFVIIIGMVSCFAGAFYINSKGIKVEKLKGI